MADQTYRVAFLPGDGIGPEVAASARRAVDAAGRRFGFTVVWDEQLIGGAALDEHGTPLPEQALRAAHGADAVLLGAVGGPRWSDPKAAQRPEQALLGLRSELELFANLRPVVAHPQLADASPLRPEVREGADLLIVRELTGGLYFGKPQLRTHDHAVDTLSYTRPEIERVVRLAYELAAGRRNQLTSVDKANVLDSSRLWREVVDEVKGDYPEVSTDHALVDSLAMALITNPKRFDVLVTENMFGDILSDEAAVIGGSLGILPSASLGTRTTQHGRFGLYEPIHGSAPDIAGKGIAHPLGTIASAAMLLRWSLGEIAAADALDKAVEATITAGLRTPDLGGNATTEQVTAAVVASVQQGVTA
jgi:3-isopropylmalate dehydrogenase